MLRLGLFHLLLVMASLGWASPAVTSPQFCQVQSSADNYSLQQCEKLKVLVLRGTPVQRIQQHGQLLGHGLSPDLISYFSDRILADIADANVVVRTVANTIYNWWIERLYRHTPAEYQSEVQAFAQASGYSATVLHRAVLMPDVASIMAGLPLRGLFDTLVNFGCTSVAKAEGADDFVYGRNLEFAGTHLYDRIPLLTVQLPEANSSELAHVTFGADGMQWGGITGVNAAGIGFAVHQLVTNGSGGAGVPMIFIGEQVLRQAHTLDEASAIVRQYRPGPMWTFVLVDLNRNLARTVEVSSDQFAERQMQQSILVQTNHVRSVENAPEIASFAWKSNSLIRTQQAESLLQATTVANLQAAAKILSFQQQYAGHLAVHRDIIKGVTIQTVLLGRHQQQKLIATSFDEAPTSSGRFAEFNWEELFSYQDMKQPLKMTVRDYVQLAPEQRARQTRLAQAAEYFDHRQYIQAGKLYLSEVGPVEQLLAAVAFYRAKDYAQVRGLILTGRQLVAMADVGDQPTLLTSWDWLEMMTDIKTENLSQAKIVAEQALSRAQDPDFIKLATKVAHGESLSRDDQFLTFSIFAGRVTNSHF